MQLWGQARLRFALLEPVPVPYATRGKCPRILSAACRRVSSKPSVALFLFTSLFRNTYAPLRWHLLALATEFHHHHIIRGKLMLGAVGEPPLPPWPTNSKCVEIAEPWIYTNQEEVLPDPVFNLAAISA